MTAADNLFQDLPGAPWPAERVDVLAQAPGLRLERIVSTGHVTPPGEWYEQATDEWVAVVRGSARLVFDDAPPVALAAGDHILIPAHRRHRVDWTDPTQPTVWLALHFAAADAAGAPPA